MVSDSLVFRQQDGTQEYPPGYLEETRGPQIVIGNAVCQLAGILLVTARIYSRLALVKMWYLEDYLLILAWLIATGWTCCQYAQVAYGSGRHTPASTKEEAVEAQKISYVALFMILPAVCLPKASICLTYIRIFSNDKVGRYVIQAVGLLLVLASCVHVIESGLVCTPTYVYWTEFRPQDKCLADFAWFYVGGCISISADFIIIGVVLPRIIGLHLNRREKLALICIVSLGFFAAAAGIARMARLAITLQSPDLDPNWDQYDVSIWTAAEIYTCVICASAPGIKPLVTKLIPKLLLTTLRSRSKSTSDPQSIELGSRIKKHSMGCMPMQKSTSDDELNLNGTSTEVDLRGDAESWDNRSQDTEPRPGPVIYKTSEFTIESSAARF